MKNGYFQMMKHVHRESRKVDKNRSTEIVFHNNGHLKKMIKISKKEGERKIYCFQESGLE